ALLIAERNHAGRVDPRLRALSGLDGANAGLDLRPQHQRRRPANVDGAVHGHDAFADGAELPGGHAVVEALAGGERERRVLRWRRRRGERDEESDPRHSERSAAGAEARNRTRPDREAKLSTRTIAIPRLRRCRGYTRNDKSLQLRHDQLPFSG